MHEPLTRSHDAPPASPRAFGLMLTVVCVVVALLPLKDGMSPRWWSLGLAIPVLFLAVVVPVVYSGLTRIWMRLGVLLGLVAAPVALTILFYGVFTPMGWVLRIFRRDILGLSYDSAARSYWVSRQPPGPDGSSLKNPF